MIIKLVYATQERIMDSDFHRNRKTTELAILWSHQENQSSPEDDKSSYSLPMRGKTVIMLHWISTNS